MIIPGRMMIGRRAIFALGEINLHRLSYEKIVARALAEDIGCGDITTGSIFSAEKGEAVIVAKEKGVIAGLMVAEEVFRQVNEEIEFSKFCHDGETVEAGRRVAALRGPVAGILMGERTALNLLQRLSGIATAASRAEESIRHTKARIIDTRKTTPGLRVLEKYAVRTGGGVNHRFNLADMVLIKDNHIKGAGSISKAVARVKMSCSFTVKIEVEAATLEEVKEALECGVDIIMVDNMTTGMMAEAVGMVAGRALVEASGGITEESLIEVAATGVDFISLGYLTNKGQALDLSLQLTSPF
jgi:nicotinate-nucleotide pyrophosphorylase (carboxylating)